MAVAVTMCKLLAALLLGYMLNKQDILDEHTGKRMSGMIVSIINPLLIISSVAGIEGDRGEILKLFFAGVVCYAAYPVIAWIVVKLFRIPINLRGTYMCMVIFSNNAFTGYPVVSALFGNGGIFYAAIFNMMFNLMIFSLGMYLIRKDAATDGVAEKTPVIPRKRIYAVRQVLNNGVIASIIALIVYFSGIRLPAVITETCSFIGNICMPLSMIVLGSTIANYSLKGIFKEKKAYLITAVRLILMPFFVYLVVRLFTDNTELIKIATITAGMPIATMVSMIANPYKEQGRVAAVAVVLTTLCSMITIPVMCILLGA